MYYYYYYLHGQSERRWDKKIILKNSKGKKSPYNRAAMVAAQVSFTRFSLYMEFYLSDLDIVVII